MNNENLETKCHHPYITIIGIQGDDEPEFEGQYWYNCIGCLTTGLDPLIGYKATLHEYDNHYVYIKEKSYIPPFLRRDE